MSCSPWGRRVGHDGGTELNWWPKQQCIRGKEWDGTPVSLLVPGNPGHTVGI